MRILPTVLLCVGLNVTAQVFLKLGSRPEAFLHGSLWRQWLTIFSSPWIVGGVGCWIVSTLLWIQVLSRNDLSYAYGLYGLNYLLTPLAARLVFGDHLNAWQWTGMALTALGVGLTVVGRSST